MRPLALVLILLLAGCSLGPLFEDAPVGEPPAEPDYRRIVAADVATRFTADIKLRPDEISPLRRTTQAQPGDWTACLRGTENEGPAFYSVFLQNHKVIDFRQSVLIDNCPLEHFERLPPPPPKKP